MLRNVKRKVIGPFVGVILMVASGVVWANQVDAFEESKFKKAQKSGKTILVAVHADWCPTCKKQSSIIEKLTKDKAFEKVVFLRLDFDHDTKWLMKFAVGHQSTLIVFVGDQEKVRSIGETNPEKVRALLEKNI